MTDPTLACLISVVYSMLAFNDALDGCFGLALGDLVIAAFFALVATKRMVDERWWKGRPRP